MKRALILILLLLLTVLSACRGETPTPPAVTEAAVTEAAVTEAMLPPTTVPETAPPEPLPEPEDSDLVAVEQYLAEIPVELKYATEDNFTGRKIYDFQSAYLRLGTVKKLAAVQADLKELGWGLKIWDAYRPVEAQFALWEACPNPAYVANPNRSFSSHSRGNTVDVTLVDDEGKELEMPTAFDSFSARADRDYSDCTAAAANNAQILEILMEKHGFYGYFKEWWHFTDSVEYPVEETFHPET